MISKALYRILSLSLWNIDQSVTCIRDHIDDYKEDSQYDYADLIFAKMIYEAEVNELFPDPKYITDSDFILGYLAYLDNINFSYTSSTKSSKTIKHEPITDENTVLKCYLYTKSFNVLIMYVIDLLCIIAKEYNEDGYDVPERLSKTINALRKRYRTQYTDAILELSPWMMTQDCFNNGYSIYDLYHHKENQ